MTADEPIRLRFAELLRDVGRVWRLELDRRLLPMGLSLAQQQVLAAVRELGAGVVQRDVAATIGIEGATLVRLLDRLVEAGLVERRDLPHDRRYKSVHLTVKGATTLDRAEVELRAIRQSLLRDVDEGDLAVAMGVFETVQATLRGERAGGDGTRDGTGDGGS